MHIEADVVELAVASAETLGQGDYPTDEFQGKLLGGLSDD